jgi:hypothetical protein
MCGTCRDETVFFSLFGPPDIFRIDEAGLRARLSGTYPGAELDRIITTFRVAARRDAGTAVLRDHHVADLADSIKIAEAKAAQRAAPVFMYQLAYPSPTRVPGTDFPIGSPHASDINLKFASTDKNLGSILNADQSPGRLATARQMSDCGRASPVRAVPPRRACRDGPPTRARTAPRCGSTPNAGSSTTRTVTKGCTGKPRLKRPGPDGRPAPAARTRRPGSGRSGRRSPDDKGGRQLYLGRPAAPCGDAVDDQPGRVRSHLAAVLVHAGQ